MDNKLSELEFHYIKANQHQEIKVDGAIGGPSPSGKNIAFSVYSERTPIPLTVVHSMTNAGDGRQELGDEIPEKREGKTGVVRVVQATLHMSLDQAKSLNKWLGDHISDIEKRADVDG